MPSQPNPRAAQEVVRSRRRARDLSHSASKRAKKPLTLRQAEARYNGSSRATIQQIVKRLEAANAADYEDIITPKMGRPRMLTDEEEEAIVAYVEWMEKTGLPASKGEIEEAATTIRRRRDPEANVVHKQWYSRFCDDHPELATAFLKAKERSRMEYEEAGIEDTKQWFKELSAVIEDLNIE
ncbi:hypothetical protein BFJ70_g8365 [Fusarium oxysporum]|nr:hypothetical protein BFJ70_g8365 [Fusarium oxysporum]